MSNLRLMVRNDENLTDEQAVERLEQHMRERKCPNCGKDLQFFDDKGFGWTLSCSCGFECGLDR